MSLSKKSLGNPYKRDIGRVRLDDHLDQDFAIDPPGTYYDYYDGPSMEDHRWGWMLSTLSKLDITAAKKLLDHWYW